MKIAVVGGGLIGREHAQRIMDHPRLELAYLVDPRLDPTDSPVGPEVPIARDLRDILGAVDGVILATPNQLHRDGTITCVEAGVRVLVEKPVADSVEAAEEMVAAADATGVPVLVGHHRRHSPLLAQAVEAVQSGVLGRLVSVAGSATFYKPDDYFDIAPWRKQAGGGPILINLIHEIDALRALSGDIVRVQATSSNATRGFDVEDTAAITLTFANGALGTFIVSDCSASARSWEQTSQENPSYDTAPDEDCYHIAGTRGSLSIPTMRLRTYDGTASWWEKFTVDTLEAKRKDPLVEQLNHFEQVIEGTAEPKVTVRDGLQSLRVVNAVLESIKSGCAVEVS